MSHDKLSAYIIDDSNVDIIVTEKMLKNHPRVGSLKCFNDPELALKDLINKIEENLPLPDMIFLDIMMPEFDGYDFIDKLEEYIDSSFASKIFILSNTDLRRHFEDFEKQRLSSDMLYKPLSGQDLDTLITKYFSPSNF